MTAHDARRRRARSACGAFCGMAAIVIGGAWGGPAGADEKADPARPGMTYKSIERLPDIGGWWFLPRDPAAGPDVLLGQVRRPILAALKPEVAAALERQMKPFGGFANPDPNPASLPDPVDLGAKPYYCLPVRFNGNVGEGTDFEFLLTPGRVTIADESGAVRRVFMNRPLPADPEESYMGSSVGHWEGRTLVVETVGLNRHAPLNLGPLMVGTHAHTVERISLKDADTLEIALTMDAPDIFARPMHLQRLYRRDREHVFHEYTNCADDDRSVDPVTGRQRFDLTPPPDLPPPPG